MTDPIKRIQGVYANKGLEAPSEADLRTAFADKKWASAVYDQYKNELGYASKSEFTADVDKYLKSSMRPTPTGAPIPKQDMGFAPFGTETRASAKAEGMTMTFSEDGTMAQGGGKKPKDLVNRIETLYASKGIKSPGKEAIAKGIETDPTWADKVYAQYGSELGYKSEAEFQAEKKRLTQGVIATGLEARGEQQREQIKREAEKPWYEKFYDSYTTAVMGAFGETPKSSEEILKMPDATLAQEGYAKMQQNSLMQQASTQYNAVVAKHGSDIFKIYDKVKNKQPLTKAEADKMNAASQDRGLALVLTAYDQLGMIPSPEVAKASKNTYDLWRLQNTENLPDELKDPRMLSGATDQLKEIDAALMLRRGVSQKMPSVSERVKKDGLMPTVRSLSTEDLSRKPSVTALAQSMTEQELSFMKESAELNEWSRRVGSVGATLYDKLTEKYGIEFSEAISTYYEDPESLGTKGKQEVERIMADPDYQRFMAVKGQLEDKMMEQTKLVQKYPEVSKRQAKGKRIQADADETGKKFADFYLGAIPDIVPQVANTLAEVAEIYSQQSTGTSGSAKAYGRQLDQMLGLQPGISSGLSIPGLTVSSTRTQKPFRSYVINKDGLEYHYNIQGQFVGAWSETTGMKVEKLEYPKFSKDAVKQTNYYSGAIAGSKVMADVMLTVLYTRGGLAGAKMLLNSPASMSALKGVTKASNILAPSARGAVALRQGKSQISDVLAKGGEKSLSKLGEKAVVAGAVGVQYQRAWVQEAMDAGMSYDDAVAYSGMVSGAVGILNAAVGNLEISAAKNLTKQMWSGITPQNVRRFMNEPATFFTKFNGALKTVLAENVQENVEDLILIPKINQLTNNILGSNLSEGVKSVEEFHDRLMEVSFITLIGTSPTAVISQMGRKYRDSEFMREYLFAAARNPEQYASVINQMQQSGQLDNTLNYHVDAITQVGKKYEAELNNDEISVEDRKELVDLAFAEQRIYAEFAAQADPASAKAQQLLSDYKDVQEKIGKIIKGEARGAAPQAAPTPEAAPEAQPTSAYSQMTREETESRVAEPDFDEGEQQEPGYRERVKREQEEAVRSAVEDGTMARDIASGKIEEERAREIAKSYGLENELDVSINNLMNTDERFIQNQVELARKGDAAAQRDLEKQNIDWTQPTVMEQEGRVIKPKAAPAAPAPAVPKGWAQSGSAIESTTKDGRKKTTRIITKTNPNGSKETKFQSFVEGSNRATSTPMPLENTPYAGYEVSPQSAQEMADEGVAMGNVVSVTEAADGSVVATVQTTQNGKVSGSKDITMLPAQGKSQAVSKVLAKARARQQARSSKKPAAPAAPAAQPTTKRTKPQGPPAAPPTGPAPVTIAPNQAKPRSTNLIVQMAYRASKVMSALGMPITFVVHKNATEMQLNTGRAGMDGFYDDTNKTIHLRADVDVTRAIHETWHPILDHIRANNPEMYKRFVTFMLNEVRKNPTLRGIINKFLNAYRLANLQTLGYTDSQARALIRSGQADTIVEQAMASGRTDLLDQTDEALTEFMTQVTANPNMLTTNGKKSLARAILDTFKKFSSWFGGFDGRNANTMTDVEIGEIISAASKAFKGDVSQLGAVQQVIAQATFEDFEKDPKNILNKTGWAIVSIGAGLAKKYGKNVKKITLDGKTMYLVLGVTDYSAFSGQVYTPFGLFEPTANRFTPYAGEVTFGADADVFTVGNTQFSLPLSKAAMTIKPKAAPAAQPAPAAAPAPAPTAQPAPAPTAAAPQPAPTPAAAPAAATTQPGEILMPTTLEATTVVQDWDPTFDNYYRPDQQRRFDQGTDYGPVFLVSHPDVLFALDIAARVINRNQGKQVPAFTYEDIDRAKEIAKSLGYNTSYDLLMAARKLAKDNRSNDFNEATLVVIGEEPVKGKKRQMRRMKPSLSQEESQAQIDGILAETVETQKQTEPVTIPYAPQGVYVNIGLVYGMSDTELSKQEIRDALPQDVEITEETRLEIGQGVEEPTMAMKLSRALTAEEMLGLRKDTKQLAIPQLTNGEGVMFGTLDWGPFNPDYFIMPDRAPLSSKAEGQVKPSLTQEEEGIVEQAKQAGTYMKAPNGNPSNLTEKQWAQVRTKAFKDWFGDWEKDPQNASKVVDENGEPLVVYHGTEVGFTEFNEEEAFRQGGIDAGFYFSSNRTVANEYGPKVIEAYLSIKNPTEKSAADIEYLSFNDKSLLESSGVDGIVARTTTGGVLETVAFYPTQIKSATENVGTFSPTEADIRFSLSATEIMEPSDIERQMIEDMNSMQLINSAADLTDVASTKETIDVNELNSRLDTPLNVARWVDFDGMPFLFTISDQLRSGDIKNTLVDKLIDNLKGGLGFNGTKGNQDKAWANTSKKEADKMLERAKELYNNNKEIFDKLWEDGKLPYGVVPMAVVKMAEGSILSNEALFRVGIQNIETLSKANRAKAVKSLKTSLTQGIKEAKRKLELGVDPETNEEYSKNTKKGFEKTITQSTEILQYLEDNNITDIVDLVKNIKSFSLPKRTIIANQIFYGKPTTVGTKPVKTTPPKTATSKTLLGDSKPELLHVGKITDLLTEPSMRNIPPRHIIAVTGVDVFADGPVKTKHPNYPWGVSGMSLGVLENPIHVKDAFGEAYANTIAKIVSSEAKEKSIKSSDAVSKAILTQSALPDLIFRNAIARATISDIDKLTSFLKNTFPSVAFFTNAEAWNTMTKSINLGMKYKSGEPVYAFTQDGNVFINPQISAASVPLREIGHMWISFIEQNNPDIYKKGLELIEGTEILAKSIQKNGDNEFARRDALATLMSSKGELIVGAAKKSNAAKEWLVTLWKYVKNHFKSLREMNVEEIQSLTLDKFIDGILADILSGEQLDKKKKAKADAAKIKASMSEAVTDENPFLSGPITEERAKNYAIKASMVVDETGFITVDSWIALLKTKDRSYLDKVIENIYKAREKLLRGQIDDEMVAKAYIITLASMGGEGMHLSTFKEKQKTDIDPVFIETTRGNPWVRLEGAAAAYLITEEGKMLVNDLIYGTLTFEQARKAFLFAGQGRENQKAEYMVKASQSNSVKKMREAFNENKGRNFDELYSKAIKLFSGINKGKTGFFNQYMGVSTMGVLDARQYNAWVAGSMTLTEEQAQRKLAAQASSAAGALILNRIEQVGLGLGYSPTEAAYIGHHAIWDAVANSITHHAGEYAVVLDEGIKNSLPQEASAITNLSAFKALNLDAKDKYALTGIYDEGYDPVPNDFSFGTNWSKVDGAVKSYEGKLGEFVNYASLFEVAPGLFGIRASISVDPNAEEKPASYNYNGFLEVVAKSEDSAAFLVVDGLRNYAQQAAGFKRGSVSTVLATVPTTDGKQRQVLEEMARTDFIPLIKELAKEGMATFAEGYIAGLEEGYTVEVAREMGMQNALKGSYSTPKNAVKYSLSQDPQSANPTMTPLEQDIAADKEDYMDLLLNGSTAEKEQVVMQLANLYNVSELEVLAALYNNGMAWPFKDYRHSNTGPRRMEGLGKTTEDYFYKRHNPAVAQEETDKYVNNALDMFPDAEETLLAEAAELAKSDSTRVYAMHMYTALINWAINNGATELQHRAELARRELGTASGQVINAMRAAFTGSFFPSIMSAVSDAVIAVLPQSVREDLFRRHAEKLGKATAVKEEEIEGAVNVAVEASRNIKTRPVNMVDEVTAAVKRIFNFFAGQGGKQAGRFSLSEQQARVEAIGAREGTIAEVMMGATPERSVALILLHLTKKNTSANAIYNVLRGLKDSGLFNAATDKETNYEILKFFRAVLNEEFEVDGRMMQVKTIMNMGAPYQMDLGKLQAMLDPEVTAETELKRLVKYVYSTNNHGEPLHKLILSNPIFRGYSLKDALAIEKAVTEHMKDTYGKRVATEVQKFIEEENFREYFGESSPKYEGRRRSTAEKIADAAAYGLLGSPSNPNGVMLGYLASMYFGSTSKMDAISRIVELSRQRAVETSSVRQAEIDREASRILFVTNPVVFGRMMVNLHSYTIKGLLSGMTTLFNATLSSLAVIAPRIVIRSMTNLVNNAMEGFKVSPFAFIKDLAKSGLLKGAFTEIIPRLMRADYASDRMMAYFGDTAINTLAGIARQDDVVVHSERGLALTKLAFKKALAYNGPALRKGGMFMSAFGTAAMTALTAPLRVTTLLKAYEQFMASLAVPYLAYTEAMNEGRKQGLKGDNLIRFAQEKAGFGNIELAHMQAAQEMVNMAAREENKHMFVLDDNGNVKTKKVSIKNPILPDTYTDIDLPVTKFKYSDLYFSLVKDKLISSSDQEYISMGDFMYKDMAMMGQPEGYISSSIQQALGGLSPELMPEVKEIQPSSMARGISKMVGKVTLGKVQVDPKAMHFPVGAHIANMAKMALFPFARIITQTGSVLWRYSLAGMVETAMDLVMNNKRVYVGESTGKTLPKRMVGADADGNIKERIRTTNEMVEVLINGLVANVGVGMALFMAMFDWDDDEIKLKEDRWIDVTFKLTGDYIQDRKSPEKRMSVRFKNDEGRWGEWITYRFAMMHIPMLTSIGHLRDKSVYGDGVTANEAATSLVTTPLWSLTEQTFAMTLSTMDKVASSFVMAKSQKDVDTQEALVEGAFAAMQEIVLRSLKTVVNGGNFTRDLVADLTKAPVKENYYGNIQNSVGTITKIPKGKRSAWALLMQGTIWDGVLYNDGEILRDGFGNPIPREFKAAELAELAVNNTVSSFTMPLPVPFMPQVLAGLAGKEFSVDVANKMDEYYNLPEMKLLAKHPRAKMPQPYNGPNKYEDAGMIYFLDGTDNPTAEELERRTEIRKNIGIQTDLILRDYIRDNYEWFDSLDEETFIKAMSDARSGAQENALFLLGIRGRGSSPKITTVETFEPKQIGKREQEKVRKIRTREAEETMLERTEQPIELE